MSTMIKEVYEAFKEAGASEEKAASAAEAMAETASADDRFEKIEIRLANLEADVKLLKWMTGFNLAISVAVLLMLISMGMK